MLRRTATPWRLAAAGPALWLVLMVAVMPMTGAGFFAGDLVGGTWPTLLGYLNKAYTLSGQTDSVVSVTNRLMAKDTGAVVPALSAAKALSGLIDAPMHAAADAVKDWPDVDLFEK